MDKRAYLIFLLDRIHFSGTVTNLVFVTIERRHSIAGVKRSSNIIESDLKYPDENNDISFDTEVCIPITMSSDSNGRHSKKIMRVQIGFYKDSKKEIVADALFDVMSVANLQDTQPKQATVKITSSLLATLTVQFVVLPASHFNGVPPRSYFHMGYQPELEIHGKEQQNQIHYIDESTIATETNMREDPDLELIQFTSLETEKRLKSPGKLSEFKRVTVPSAVVLRRTSNVGLNEKKLIQSHHKSLSEFLTVKQPKPNVSNKDTTIFSAPDPIINDKSTDLKKAIKTQKKLLSKILLDQFSLKFTIKCFKNFSCGKTKTKDFSSELLQPIIQYNILQIPKLTPEKFKAALEPLFQCLRDFLSHGTDSVTQVALLATLINFGIGLTNEAELYTSVHLEAISQLEEQISQIMCIIVGALSAPIAASIDNSNSFNASSNGLSKQSTSADGETRAFFNIVQSFSVPRIVIEQIVKEAAAIVDGIVFNATVQFCERFDASCVQSLRFRIAQVRQLFARFLPAPAALPQLESLADTASEMVDGTLKTLTPLAAAIAPRIVPKFVSADLPKAEYPDVAVSIDSQMSFSFEDLRLQAFREAQAA